MPSIEIPEIYIPEIYVPNVPEPYNPHYLQIAKPPEIDAPGCTYQHRDIKNTGNRNLLLDDPNGVYSTCDFAFPSFIPLDYTPENLVITEEVPLTNETPPLPETKQPEIPEIPKKKDIELEPCPGKKDQKIGDYRNEKRISRVSGHLRSEDGTECITLYENVTFIDSVLPSPSAALNVVTISLIATSSSLLIPAIKSLSKTAFKKIFAKFNNKKK